jgi:mannose-1-phosphate guanylyltransferase / mannose-6-phosphate isomerase
MIIPVILAGGSGTRLWPLSRELYPKQLIRLFGRHTLLQNTILRIADFEDMEPPVVICNEEHRFMVAEQIRDLDVCAKEIILEPVGRNTAPAVAIAALKMVAAGADPTLLVLPADHHIENVSLFHQALKAGVELAQQGRLITFGIVPHAPETGYGYIRKGRAIGARAGASNGAVHIAEFVEKPDFETAGKYLQSGEYCWNSGMFMFQATTVLKELKQFAPEMVSACESAIGGGAADLDFYRLDRDAFERCPGNSIDYAVMEKTAHGVMIPLQAGWNDLGSWETLWREGEKDARDNVMHGDVMVHDVQGSYLHAADRMIAAVGLTEHVVIETADAVFIAPRGRTQEVKQIVKQIKDHRRGEACIHHKDYRPWGVCEKIDASGRFEVKRLTIRPGEKLSLQQHAHRAEHWIVVRGTARVCKGEAWHILAEDQSIYIPIGTPHRLENPGETDLEIIEVRTGTYLGEDDVVRLDDIYGRGCA